MNIVQCQFCRKPFAGLGGRVCPDCMQQLDKDFITVRDYIYDHCGGRPPNIKTISDETEVPEQHIIYLIKEGRLIIDNPAGDGGGLIVCEMCKKSIKTGRLCDDCAKSLTSSVDKAVPAKPAEKPKADTSAQDFKKLGRIR